MFWTTTPPDRRSKSLPPAKRGRNAWSCTSTGGDRNLTVDRIRIDGATYETEAPTVFSVGSQDPTNFCGPGYQQHETLYGNGYFQYAAPAGSIAAAVAMDDAVQATSRNQRASLEVDDGAIDQAMLELYGGVVRLKTMATTSSAQRGRPSSRVRLAR